MVTDRACKCCGQTLPLPFPFEVGSGFDFSKGDRELINSVYSAGAYGIQIDRLIDKMYGDDPNGGPENAPKTIHVRICKINKRLRKRGWHIQGRGHHNGIYVLEKLPLAPTAVVDVIRYAIGAA